MKITLTVPQFFLLLVAAELLASAAAQLAYRGWQRYRTARAAARMTAEPQGYPSNWPGTTATYLDINPPQPPVPPRRG